MRRGNQFLGDGIGIGRDVEQHSKNGSHSPIRLMPRFPFLQSRLQKRLARKASSNVVYRRRDFHLFSAEVT